MPLEAKHASYPTTWADYAFVTTLIAIGLLATVDYTTGGMLTRTIGRLF